LKYPYIGIARRILLLTTRSGDRFPLGGGGIFSARPDRPKSPFSLLYNKHRVITGGKEAGALTKHHHPAPRLKKEYSYNPTPATGLHALFKGKFCFWKF
jgi:hypothetical protein